MAVYAEAEDLINVGAYHSGSNPAIDEAIAKHQNIENFLIQDMEEKSSLAETLAGIGEISGLPIPETELDGQPPLTPETEAETVPAAPVQAESVAAFP
jgi:flagellum-specific ATP synthase